MEGSGPGTRGAYWPLGFSGPVDWYWSSSSWADNSLGAWGVNFNSGSIGETGTYRLRRVRCVRGGP
jgi:hypothetical protein